MTQPVVPESVSTNGTTTVVIMTAVQTPTAPKITEIEAVSSLDLSPYLPGDGLNTETTEATTQDDRLSSKRVFEGRGDITDLFELTYFFNPTEPEDDEARLTLVEGSFLYAAVRYAVDNQIPMDVDDVVDLYYLEMGVQRKGKVTRNGFHKITQKGFIRGGPWRDVKIVAGS